MGHPTRNMCPLELHETNCNGHLLEKLASLHKQRERKPNETYSPPRVRISPVFLFFVFVFVLAQGTRDPEVH